MSSKPMMNIKKRDTNDGEKGVMKKKTNLDVIQDFHPNI